MGLISSLCPTIAEGMNCFVESQLFSLARQTEHFKLGLKPVHFYVRLSMLLLNHQATYVSSGITTHYVLAFGCLYFALPDSKVHYSLEELCITRVVAVNSFIRVLNPQGGEHCITRVAAVNSFVRVLNPQGGKHCITRVAAVACPSEFLDQSLFHLFYIPA